MIEQARPLTSQHNARLVSLCATACLVTLVTSFAWALSPEIHYDSLNYHLGTPHVYNQAGRILELPYTFYSYHIGPATTLWGLALATVGQPLPQLIHLSFGLLLAAALYSLARGMFGARVGVVSVALFLTTPFVAWLIGTSYIDLVISLYAFGLIHSFIRWRADEKPGWLVLGGIMAGFAFAVKLNVILVLIPFASILLFLLARRRSSLKYALAVSLRLAVPALLVASPWFILRAVWTGNPFFPFLNAVFRSPKWPYENTLQVLGEFGFGVDASALLALPWNLTVSTMRFAEAAPNGIAGVLPLLSLPLFLFFLDPKARSHAYLIIALALGSILCWFWLGQFTRYLLPVFPILAVMAALNLEVLIRSSRNKHWSKALSIAGLGAALAYLLACQAVTTVWHWNLPERYPHRVALGIESRKAYLSRVLPVYDAFSFIERERGAGTKVFSVGNEFRLYSSAEIHGVWGSRRAGALTSIENLATLHATLRSKGYTLMLVNWREVNSRPSMADLPVLSDQFLTRYARLVFARNDVSVYDLSASLSNSPGPGGTRR